MAGLFRALGILTIVLAVIYGFIQIGSARSGLQQFMTVLMTIGIGLGSLMWFFMGEVVGLLAEIRDRMPAPQPAPSTEPTQQIQEEGRPA